MRKIYDCIEEDAARDRYWDENSVEIEVMDLEFQELAVGDKFVIDDLAKADWAFRKLKEIEDSKNEKIEYAKEQIEIYKHFIQSIEKSVSHEKAHLEFLLKEFLDRQREENPSYKLKTAVGGASYSKKTTWDYGDEKKLIEFLKQENLNEFVRTKITEEVNKVDLKKSVIVSDDGTVVTSDGEIIEGISVTVTQDFKITL